MCVLANMNWSCSAPSLSRQHLSTSIYLCLQEKLLLFYSHYVFMQLYNYSVSVCSVCCFMVMSLSLLLLNVSLHSSECHLFTSQVLLYKCDAVAVRGRQSQIFQEGLKKNVIHKLQKSITSHSNTNHEVYHHHHRKYFKNLLYFSLGLCYNPAANAKPRTAAAGKTVDCRV